MNFDFTKKRPLAVRLAAYILAGGAVCMTQQAASAGVIYVNPADIDLTSNQTVALDLNADTVNDYNVRTFAGAIGMMGFDSSEVIVTGLVANVVSASLSPGASIGNTTAFNPSQLVLKDYSFAPSSGSTSAVLGLRFDISGNTHYGWLRLAAQTDVFVPEANARVFDWAYEDTANTSLTAPAALGDPYAAAAVPEPSSVALMALGAAGIAALKARRKRQLS